MCREIVVHSRSEFEAFRPECGPCCRSAALLAAARGPGPLHPLYGGGGQTPPLGLSWSLFSECSRLIRFLYGPLELNKPNLDRHEYS